MNIVVLVLALLIHLLDTFGSDEFELDLCQGNDHVNGYWRYDDSLHEKLHECCSIEDDETMRSSRSICSNQTFNKDFQNHFQGSSGEMCFHMAIYWHKSFIIV